MRSFDALGHQFLLAATWLVSTSGAIVIFWMWFGACVDTPLGPDPPRPRVVVAWDPVACGDPHRVFVELSDETGTRLSNTAPCELGGVSVELPHFGTYRGRVFARAVDHTIRSIADGELVVEEPIVRWSVEVP